MSDGRKQFLRVCCCNIHTDISLVNQARALRLAEIMNDYRTLLLHIPQQAVDVPPEDYWEEGYVMIRECLASAQRLMGSNYSPSQCAAGQRNDDEAEKVEFQRYLSIVHPVGSMLMTAG